MTTGLNGCASLEEESAMTLGERVLPVSPGLIQKYGSGFRGLENGGVPGSGSELVTALEQTLDNSKEIVLAEETKPNVQLDHVIDLETPEPESPHEVTEMIVVSESSTELPKFFHPPHSNSPRESKPALFDVHVDITERPKQDLDDISTDSDEGFLVVPDGNGSRRPSNWSAHVLFLASEVQLMVNLADYSPEDGYETKPTPKGGNDENDNMSYDKDDVELQPLEPLKSKDNPPIQNYSSDQTNGGLTQLCDNNGYSPPNGNPGSSDKFDNTDNHSLLNNKCDNNKDNDEKKSITSEDSHPPREDWGHKADFLLAVIGYAVDLSNVWRFPYLCYRNGGGAFIIPYFTVLVLGALPVFFMELCLGQYHREGPITIWKIAPIFKGIGYASCFLAYIVAFYYNVVIGWAFFYLFSSFTSNLPWSSCHHGWNTPNCWELEGGRYNGSASVNSSAANATRESNHSVSSSFEFFERGMLQLHRSTGIDDLGGVRWELVLCTLLTFTCLYFSLWKGVKSSGKVVYVTATMPYIILTILLIRGCLLPGAVEGMKYFITPNLERLNDPQVWIDAAIQIMFSIGAGFGTHIAYASHNKFTNNCYLDCLFTTAVNSFTSIFSGFVVFSYLGYMADRQQKHIRLVAQEGPGLVFIVYPEAIATLPGSTAWSIIFFIMLITLGLDSAFGGLESPLTGISDQFYKRFKKKWSRELLTFIVVCSAFVCSIPCSTMGGMYVFKILDTFAAGTSILFAVLCQVIAVSWFYGIDQFCADIHKMIGYLPGLYWRICWKFLTPTFLLMIVISSILHYEPLTYQGGSSLYVYPEYANIIGWFIALASMSIIPLYAIYYIFSSRGTAKERISLAISPKWEHGMIKEEHKVKRFTRQHWVYI